MTSNIQLQTKYRGSNDGAYPIVCERCSHHFKNESYFRWRLQPDDSYKYLRGMFWTIHCRDCLLATKEQWIKSLEELQV